MRPFQKILSLEFCTHLAEGRLTLSPINKGTPRKPRVGVGASRVGGQTWHMGVVAALEVGIVVACREIANQTRGRHQVRDAIS